MPLFSRKGGSFRRGRSASPAGRKGKTSARASSSSLSSRRKHNKEEVDDDEWGTTPITLKLGNHHLEFEHGKWTTISSTEEKDSASATGSTSSRTAGATSKKDASYVKALEEENRLLKFKIDVLVDMLTLARAESEGK